MKNWIIRYMSPFSTMPLRVTARRRHISRSPLPASVAKTRSAKPGGAAAGSPARGMVIAVMPPAPGLPPPGWPCRRVCPGR